MGCAHAASATTAWHPACPPATPPKPQDKHYPRTWWIRGRLKVQLKNADGTYVNADITSSEWRRGVGGSVGVRAQSVASFALVMTVVYASSTYVDTGGRRGSAARGAARAMGVACDVQECAEVTGWPSPRGPISAHVTPTHASRGALAERKPPMRAPFAPT